MVKKTKFKNPVEMHLLLSTGFILSKKFLKINTENF